MAAAALVVGGSSGIGLAIARMLSEEGYELTLAARNEARLRDAAAEVGAEPLVANVAVEEDCERLVRAHAERFGRLDVLVNSAGVGSAGSIAQLETKSWDLQLAVNLRGLFLVTRAALPLLAEARGLVVNLASIAGVEPAPRLAAYSAAKAGVIQLTRSLNLEHAGDGIRATALCPGFVDTPMAAWARIPTEQMIRPEDCAELVRALLRLGPAARVPQIVIERVGAPADGD
jgi:NAD(P)-dependent dehydrogenase (short-subunit alcohol dehydrogenase family)